MDARGNATTYTYDVLGRPKTVIAKSGDADSTTNLADVAYNYHVNGGIDNIQYNEGKGKYLFLYDEFGRNDMVWIGIGDSLRCVVENDYNSRNLLIGQNYGNGKSVNFAYDTLDRLVGKGYNGSVDTFTYAYDAEGRLALEKDTVNNTRVRYTYDMAGRLVQWTQRNGASVDSGDILAQIQYRYNAKNQPSFLFYQHAGIARLGYQYIYGYGRLRDKVTQIRDGAVYRLSYGYDLLGRRSSRQLQVTEDSFPSANNAVQTTYTYVDHPTDENRTSGLLESVTHSINGVPFYRAVYTYDANGNITSITEGVNETTTVSYEYDALNQLVRVNDEKNDVTYRYAYDKAGNLISRTPFAYTTGALGSASSDALYSYGDSGWCDLLTSYNGTAITYDDIGNPLNWRDGMSFMWQNGRQLYMMSHYGVSALYNYNADGLRTKKMYGGTTTTYYWANGLLLGEVRTNGNTLTYLYDENGTMYGFELNGVRYYYLYNGQGDVIGLIDATGAVIAHYEYDAWGKLLSVTDANGEEILYGTEVAIINPIRYRGYYYDNETGFYYLNSRYYDPEVGRFINADAYASTGQGILGHNMFAYCQNNPIIHVDPTGRFAWWIFAIMGGCAIIGGVCGALSDQKMGEIGYGDSEASAESSAALAPDFSNVPSLDSISLSPSSVSPPKNKSETFSAPSKPNPLPKKKDTLTVGDRVQNTIIGASAGLLVGGATVAVVGLAGAFAVGSGTAIISSFGASGAQTFALGALVYDAVAMLIAPIFGIEIEPIEYEP